jgi:hypothetical protein
MRQNFLKPYSLALLASVAPANIFALHTSLNVGIKSILSITPLQKSNQCKKLIINIVSLFQFARVLNSKTPNVKIIIIHT